MENQNKSLSPSTSLESELSLDTSSLASSPSPTNDNDTENSGSSSHSSSSSSRSSSSGIASQSDSACSTRTEPDDDEEEGKESDQVEEKMVVKEKSVIITTTSGGNGGITSIPEAILNEAKTQLREASSEFCDNAVVLENNTSKNRLNQHLHHQNNLRNSDENRNGEHDHHHHHEHHHHHPSDDCNSALELNNQLNMLERILFPESHHKIITPRITITIDPGMVFDECEEDDDSDDAEEGVAHRIVVVAEEFDDGDDYSSVFMDELSSETGMSEKTLADLEIVDEAGDDILDDLDDDIGVLDDVSRSSGSSGSDGGSTSSGSKGGNGISPSTITIDDSGIIITCEKYGKVPIEIINEHLLGAAQSTPSADVELDNVSNNSNANHEPTEKAVLENEQHEHTEGDEESHLNSVVTATSTITESSEQQQQQQTPRQETDHQSNANVISTSPQNHKLGRTSSSPSNTNLSEPNSEPSESGGLKTEEVKPRRRNTIADIFRWLIESDSKSCNSLPGAANNSTHSRKSSDTSELSLGQSSDKGSEQETEEDLWITWGRIVNEWETYWKKKNQFVRDLVKRGIPHHFRGIVWQLLCGAHDSPDKAKYADYIKATSACEKVIRRDIARTYPEHDFFKEKDGLGQESLFNVMKAYSLHDREVGYCQGSAFIVGLLLMQMPEEEAFAVLVKLMQDYRLREMFKPSMAELGLCMYQLEMCVQEQYPELHVHFTSQGFHTSMYASSWFLTIFTTSLPLGVASRIMDVFLMDGIEVVFRIALAILSMAKHELLSLDMEGMLKHLQKELPPQIEADPENLFSAAFNVKYNAKKMKKLEKDYAAMKTKEQEEMVELRRLRTENKLLKQRIEVLESESSELANKLIQGQVGRAEEVETTFALKRELAAVRQHYLEAMKQLENVAQQYQNLLLVLDETNSTKQTSMDEISLKSELLKQKEELIQCLQNELVEVRLQEAENAVIHGDLRSRIQELEEEKKKLRESVVDNSVAHLQEELIAVKLREAEASLSLKDLRQKVADLTTQWQRHLQEQEDGNTEKKGTATPLGNLFTSNRMDVQRLEEDVMSLKLREMHTIIELKEHRLKIMELETQVQVTTNQLKRQEDQSRQLKEELETSYAQNKDFQSKLKDERRRYSDLESKLKEDSVHARIKDAEKSQRMFDLSQVISALQLKNQELMTEKEMMSGRCVSSSSESNGDKLDSESDTQERIKELQDTISTLTIQLESLKEQSQQYKSSATTAAEVVTSPSTNGNGSKSTTTATTTNGSSCSSNSNINDAASPSSIANGVESEP